MRRAGTKVSAILIQDLAGFESSLPCFRHDLSRTGTQAPFTVTGVWIIFTFEDTQKVGAKTETMRYYAGLLAGDTMITITAAARRQLLQLIAEHPDDPVVRLSITDLDHQRVAFSITLESEPRLDDAVQNWDGLQVAVEGRSAARLDGVTMDYTETDGFKFLHPGHAEQDKLRAINLN